MKRLDRNDIPHELAQMIDCETAKGQYFVAAKASKEWGDGYSHTYSALVQSSKVSLCISNFGAINHEVSLHFEVGEEGDNFLNRFRIRTESDALGDLEPLVDGWTTGSHRIMVPANTFLGEFRLVPRAIDSESGSTIFWDDLSLPEFDIVVVNPTSRDVYSTHDGCSVLIKDSFIREYATLRECSVVHVYYRDRRDLPMEVVGKLLDGERFVEFEVESNRFTIMINEFDASRIYVRLWGVKEVIEAGERPVSQQRDDYGSLQWPGIENPVTEWYFGPGIMPHVFVRDTVLEKYEMHSERFDIDPELGAVGYGNSWGVGYCRRLGRDLIHVELKKLYEGAPASEVHHWHKHAVSNPNREIQDLAQTPNVATRTKRIVFGLTNIGGQLSDLYCITSGVLLGEKEFVGISRTKSQYSDWSKQPSVAPVTHHIPLNLSRDRFLSRCGKLFQLVAEGLSERNLRKLLIDIGIESQIIKEYKSLKLLDMLLQFCLLVQSSGLDLLDDKEELANRFDEKIRKGELVSTKQSQIAILFTVRQLRVSEAHRDINIEDVLRDLGASAMIQSERWGELLDKIYDSIGDSLEKVVKIIGLVVRSQQE